jgi:formyl-CoA transferase/succinyl-CoA--D-citramalate CoA-transferase
VANSSETPGDGESPSDEVRGPLTGVTVIEMGSFIAGPFAGQLLGDYGADVIKIEPPGSGDPMRKWGILRDNHSLWWPSIARNKRSVCIDLRVEEGRHVIKRLARGCDIVVENFRPGRLNEWGLGFADLSPLNPALVMVHVSGFGQTGPKAKSAGFGSIGEAVGGIRYSTGSPDSPPSRTGISLGDSLAGIFSVVGALAALNEARTSGRGQEVDVAIYEAVAALMESSMADFELGGVLRERSGGILPGVAPSNAYPAKDGSDVVIAGNADSVFARLCEAMGQPELASDPRFDSHISRGQHMQEIDALIAQWTATKNSDELIDLLEASGVPAGKIFTAKDMLNDDHYVARDMVVRKMSAQNWELPMPGIVPKFSKTPGGVRTVGPVLGADTREVLERVGGISADEVDALQASGTIYCATDS